MSFDWFQKHYLYGYWVWSPIKENQVLGFCVCSLQGLFFSILWCGRIGDHVEEDLAEFGYKAKIKKNKN